MKTNRVIEGKIGSPFGMRIHPIDGSHRIHQGVDVGAPCNTPIYSPCVGWVSAIYNHASGGLTLIIGGEDDLRYGMCHLQNVEVAIGQRLVAGQLVARSGNSGHSTGPHLHFSVKSGGNWVGNVYNGGNFVDSAPYLDIE